MVAFNDITHAKELETDQDPIVGTYYVERMTNYLKDILQDPVLSFQYDGSDRLNKGAYIDFISSLMVSRDENGNVSGGEVPGGDEVIGGKTTHIVVKEILPEPTSRGSIMDKIVPEEIDGMDVALGFLIEVYKLYDDEDTIKETYRGHKIISFKRRDFTDEDTGKRFHNLWYAIFQIEKEADEERVRSYGK